MKKRILMSFLLMVFMAFSSFSQITAVDLFRMKTVAEVVVSPNGQYIAYTLNIPRGFDGAQGGDYRQLFVYQLSNGQNRALTNEARTVFSIRWHPSSESIYFRANYPSSQGVQIYGISLNNGETFPVTNHTESVMAFDFASPTVLVLTAQESIGEEKKLLLSNGFDAEFYEEEARPINLYTFNTANNQTRQITRDVAVFDFTVSPDGSKIAAAIAPNNLVDDSYMFKRIYVVDMQTFETTLVMENPGKLGKLAWSPDSRKLAFTAASDLYDSVEGSLYAIDIPNNKGFEELRNYVFALPVSVVGIGWKDNNTLLYSSEEGVDIVLSEIGLNMRSRRVLLPAGQLFFRNFSHSGNLIAMAGNTATHPSELHVLNMADNQLRRLTHNNEWLNDVRLARQEKISYAARDGLDIEGVLIYPLNYVEGQKYPLIVYIHGGPEAAVQNGWTTFYSRWGQIAAASDYFVFMPNYRASSGRGVEFTMMGFGDLAGKEYDDVIDGIDHLIGQGFVDRNRVGIGGGSYGGYFAAMSATRHSERFAAAVVFVGIANQISKRNTTDIPYEDYYVHWGFWTHENYEKVYEASPVKYAHQSRTPTLILHGKEDPRIPVSQGMELYRSLKLHGDAPVRLVLYPGEGHGNRRNTSRLDYIVRTMQWFDYYLKEGNDKSQMPKTHIDFQSIINN